MSQCLRILLSKRTQVWFQVPMYNTYSGFGTSDLYGYLTYLHMPHTDIYAYT